MPEWLKSAVYWVLEFCIGHLLWDFIAAFLGVHGLAAIAKKYFVEKLVPSAVKKSFYWRETLGVTAFLCVLSMAFQAPINLNRGGHAHFHIELLTFDQKRGQNIWLHLTNDFLTQTDPRGIPFASGAGGVLALPIRPDIAHNFLQICLLNDSANIGTITDIKLQWRGNCSLQAASNQTGWQGSVADLDRGFLDCVGISPVNPFQVRANHPFPLPPLQFKLDTNQEPKGVAELSIIGTDFNDISYIFGVQYVKDTNWTAYVIEEQMRKRGDDFDFLVPVRPR